jgi:hypothetical protein
MCGRPVAKAGGMMDYDEKHPYTDQHSPKEYKAAPLKTMSVAIFIPKRLNLSGNRHNTV